MGASCVRRTTRHAAPFIATLGLVAGLLALTSPGASSAGTVVAWGYDVYGETDVPASLSGVTGIAAGYYHSLALVGTVNVACPTSGTSKSDTIYGTSGEDTICGRAGNDTIYAGAGNDAIYGDHGNDTLVGGPGSDRLVGGDGFDVLRSTDGAPGDHLNGGHGYDRCVLDPGDVTRRCEQTVVRWGY
jgi:Ca2+-binding RTX toxin-like protein